MSFFPLTITSIFLHVHAVGSPCFLTYFSFNRFPHAQLQRIHGQCAGEATMDDRPVRYEISKPLHLPPPPLPPPPPPPPIPQQLPDSPLPWTTVVSRPLSDIRELSEPSLMDHLIRQPSARFRQRRDESRARSLQRHEPKRCAAPAKASQEIPKFAINAQYLQEAGSSSYSSTPEQSTFYSIPNSSVPQRSSSQTHGHRQPKTHSRKPSIRTQSKAEMAPPFSHGFSIPNRGGSDSPVKEVGMRLDPITSDAARRIPSQTHVRSPHPSDILESPSYKHPRIKLELQISAPVFVGGGSVEGYVRVTVDDNERVRHRRSLSIGAISVDLLGFEEMGPSRRSTFLALGTELIDGSHPPPPTMVQPANPLFADDKFWSMAPSCSALPFMISLPLDTGPPPFQSRHANIRFLLCVTALVRDAGKHYRVRTSQDVSILPTYDPEKALTSLPSPLTAAEEMHMPRSGGHESLKVTAGLHRQVWVSGSSIFVDVHISNKCRKPVKKLELALERNILCYKHAAAATMEKSAGQARIFETNEQTILARSACKPSSSGWNGVEPHTSDTRTCELELPRGHGTVRCGKYFEVRYFLNVIVSLSSSKSVSIQLPIILIHINSLDVVPNSVAQVAAAIEEKRAHRQASHARLGRLGGSHLRQRSFSSPARTSELEIQPSYAQGRAFAAPRQQSLDRQREHQANLENLRDTLDSSPRKFPPPSLQGITIKKVASNLSLGALGLSSKSTESLSMLGAMSYRTPPANRNARNFDLAGNETDGIRDRLRRIRSFDSVRSRKSLATSKPHNQNIRPIVPRTSSHTEIAPHTLGLTTTTRKVSIDAPSERSATAMSFREKLDRSRFEFKAVRRKASGGLKERSMNWFDQKRRDRSQEGWI